MTESDLDAVIDVTGFAFGDEWADSPLGRRARNYERWRFRGVPVYMLPQAFGPFRSTAAPSKLAIESARLVYARDADSLDYVSKLFDGQMPHGVRLAPDFTVSVPGIFPRAVSEPRRGGPRSCPTGTSTNGSRPGGPPQGRTSTTSSRPSTSSVRTESTPSASATKRQGPTSARAREGTGARSRDRERTRRGQVEGPDRCIEAHRRREVSRARQRTRPRHPVDPARVESQVPVAGEGLRRRGTGERPLRRTGELGALIEQTLGRPELPRRISTAARGVQARTAQMWSEIATDFAATAGSEGQAESSSVRRIGAAG